MRFWNTPPTLSQDGDASDGVVDAKGSLKVTLTDRDGTTGAKVAATGSIAEGDNAFAVQAPVLGAKTGGKVITDTQGSIQQYLRGLIALLVAATGDAAASAAVPAAAGLFYNGSTWDRARTPNVFKRLASTAVTAGTPATIWTPSAGKKFRLLVIFLSNSAASQFIFLDNATEILRGTSLGAGAQMSVGTNQLGYTGLLSASADNPLKVDVTTSGNIAGFVAGTEE
jgi:hypothetical protein